MRTKTVCGFDKNNNRFKLSGDTQENIMERRLRLTHELDPGRGGGGALEKSL